MNGIHYIRKAYDLQGACNMRALARLLTDMADNGAPKLAMRLLMGHMQFLCGEGLGPSSADLDEAARLLSAKEAANV